MTISAAWSRCFDFFGKPLVIEPVPGQLSSDAGLLLIRPFDQRIGPTRANACAFSTDFCERRLVQFVALAQQT